jgi:hypothetical protein
MAFEHDYWNLPRGFALVFGEARHDRGLGSVESVRSGPSAMRAVASKRSVPTSTLTAGWVTNTYDARNIPLRTWASCREGLRVF